MTTQVQKVLYTAKTHTTGGRDGASRSSDGRLDVKLSTPGPGGGTNPEQLFAAGWSACFIGAMSLAAAQMKVAIPRDRAVDAEVDLGTNDGGYVLRARLNVSLPGLDRDVAKDSGRRPIRRAPTPKRLAVTSTSKSTSYESDRPARSKQAGHLE